MSLKSDSIMSDYASLTKPHQPIFSDTRTYDTVVHPTGTVSVTATKNLKRTEAYPAQFGQAIAVSYNSLRQSWSDEGIGLASISGIPCSDESWGDANLDIVVRDLEKLRSRIG